MEHKFFNLAVTCWNCKSIIGTIGIREDLLAIPKPEEGSPFTDQVVVGFLNGLFNGLTTAKPSTMGLICPECHKSFVNKGQAEAMAGVKDVHYQDNSKKG